MQKKLETLNLKRVEYLSLLLGVDKGELQKIALNSFSSSSYRRSNELSRGKKRLISRPHRKLALIHGRIKDRILSRIAVSKSTHGWTKGKSHITHSSQHVGKDVVVTLDIKDFFPSIHFSRIYRLFVSLGCSPDVARILTQLTTCDYCLPQGTHTSPAIANLVLKPLDTRLENLQELYGIRYSHCGDDICISGRCGAVKLKSLLVKIVRQEGFRINKEKIKVQHKHQRQEVTGVVVNEKLNIPKEKRRELLDQIHRCQKYGPSTQTTENKEKFKQRLKGKIAYARYVNPRLGKLLEKEFSQIDWLR